MRIVFPSLRCRLVALLLALAVPCVAGAEPVAVRHRQGLMHRYFLLKAPGGKVLAGGEEISYAEGDTVHSKLIFRFRDGSVDDEETVFTEVGAFHLLSEHHIQKGPSFPTPLDLIIDVPSKKVTWLEQSRGGNRYRSQHVDFPTDLANGMVPLLVENFPLGAPEMKLSWVAIALRPLVVTLSVRPVGAQTVDPDGVAQRTIEYVIHPELHGLVSFLAPLVSRQPADLDMWVSDDASQSFVQMTGPFYQGAPDWTVVSAGPPAQ